MRLLIKLKLFALIAIWSVICLGIYAVLALGEAVLEIGAGAAGAAIGQGGAASGLVDLTGDIIQWGVGLMWIIGVAALWYVKRLLTSREERARAGGFAVKAAGVAAPYVINKHPIGRVLNTARGPAGRWIGAMLAKRAAKR
jgi:membrane protein implicated in regulation of membrane protease activity